MQQRAHRPRSVGFEHKEVTARIHFVWGHIANPIPDGLYISVQRPGTNIVIIEFEGARYPSFFSALERGRKLATLKIDDLSRKN